LDYSKIKNKEDFVSEWGSHLSEEEKICLQSDLNDYEWYAVSDENGKTLAIFQIISVLDQYSKNLNVKFSPKEFSSLLLNREDLDKVIEVIVFIFFSIIEICQDDQVKKIKLHTHDEIMGKIFSGLIDLHDGVKNIKKYGKWIEAEIIYKN